MVQYICCVDALVYAASRGFCKQLILNINLAAAGGIRRRIDAGQVSGPC